jgi:hypothetical protein
MQIIQIIKIIQIIQIIQTITLQKLHHTAPRHLMKTHLKYKQHFYASLKFHNK